jgi:hypothetical protein
MYFKHIFAGLSLVSLSWYYHIARYWLTRTKTERKANIIEKDLEPTFLTTLPNYSNPIFAGREDELARVRKLFASAGVWHQMVLLWGLGSIG